MEQWHTLHTKPNSEYRVAGALRQRDIEVYLPELRQARKREPFFPCYLFMLADLEKISPSQWQWTPGLRRIVSFGGRPAALPDDIINLIRRKVDEMNVNSRTFRSGDTVRVKEGPLQGMLAIFDRYAQPGQRVQVLLTILGKASRVRLDAADLEKISSGVQGTTLKRSRRTRGRGRRVR